MAYFDGEVLKFNDGTISKATYEDLERVCLDYAGNSLRISTIIFSQVGEFIGEQVKAYKNYAYTRSSLYCKLEKAIQGDKRYLERKRNFQKIQKEASEKAVTEKKGEVDFYGVKSQKIRVYFQKIRNDRPSSRQGYYPTTKY